MMYKYKYFLVLFAVLLFLPLSGFAQKKQISQARDYIKSGNNLQVAEQLMTDLLKDSANRGNMKIWTTLFESVKAQYDQGNEKLYLKQQCDTAAIFNTTYRLFSVLEQMDSVDAMPDEKGTVKLKFRKSHAEYLNTYRPNLFNGGAYFINKKNYQRAFDFFDAYIDCHRQPLFSAYHYMEQDKHMAEAAYWASYCGYKEKDVDKTGKYLDLALRDTTRRDFLLQFKCEMLKMKGDSTAYVGTLREGFDLYPSFPFFFPRLIDYYAEHDLQDSAMAVVNKALAIDSANVLYRFTKSTVLLNTGKYDECIDICKRLLAENDTLADAHFNIGLAYFNKAIELDKVSQRYASARKKIIENYTKSRPYMERYRQLAPDQKQKWAPVLYTIYLNLNMGKEFDEIDRLMKK